MDSLAHLFITYQLISTERDVLIAGLAAVLRHLSTVAHHPGKFIGALKTSEWPEAPAWMYTAHHGSFSHAQYQEHACVVRQV